VRGLRSPGGGLHARHGGLPRGAREGSRCGEGGDPARAAHRREGQGTLAQDAARYPWRGGRSGRGRDRGRPRGRARRGAGAARQGPGGFHLCGRCFPAGDDAQNPRHVHEQAHRRLAGQGQHRHRRPGRGEHPGHRGSAGTQALRDHLSRSGQGQARKPYRGDPGDGRASTSGPRET